MKTGIVIIGRNEGERLVRCLNSVTGHTTIYVDSGSTDDSITNAQSVGANCVELDLSKPFTAARARNAGFAKLIEIAPTIEYVQFIDGDCEVCPNWIAQAEQFLDKNTTTGVVCGRRKERFPESSLYNLMCDIEWDTPIGSAKACGGDALYRVDVFKHVNGFDDGFIAGEEPELCFRIRQENHEVHRLDLDMTLHDAAMTKLSQWWKRNKRAGYAFTLNALKHGSTNQERYYVKNVRSTLTWLAIYLFFTLTLVVSAHVMPLIVLLALVLIQSIRMTQNNNRQARAFGKKAIFIYSLYTMLGKIPQSLGVINCYIKYLTKQQQTLIEYK